MNFPFPALLSKAYPHRHRLEKGSMTYPLGFCLVRLAVLLMVCLAALHISVRAGLAADASSTSTPSTSERSASEIVTTADSNEDSSGDPNLEDAREHGRQILLYNKKLRSLAAELFSDLGSQELQLVYDIRTDYGIVQSVRYVHQDINHAVENCLKRHPKMTSLKTSFKKWHEELDPLIEEAEQHLRNSIEEQKIVDAKKLQEYLITIDMIAALQEKWLDKQYVESEKACHNLESKLKETRKGLAGLIRQALEET